MKTSLKINKSSGCYFLIFTAIVLEHCFFYLVPENISIMGMGILDICSFLEIFLFLFVLVTCGGKLPKSKYSWMVYMALLLICTSAIAGTITYGQSVLSGLLVQRNRIGSLLLYLTMLIWYRRNLIDEEGLLKLLQTFVTIYLGICCAQYLLGGVVTFTYTGAEGTTRYGSIRYWFSCLYIVFIAGHWADGIFYAKKKYIKKILGITLTFIFLFVIVKTRMTALAFLGTFVICIIIHKSNARKKMFGFCMVFIAIVFLSSTSIGEDIMSVVIGGPSSSGDTLTVRTMGRAYYIGQTFQNPLRAIIGCGYATGNNSNALSMTYPSMYSSSYGYSVALYPQDNGIIGMLYYYGLLGIAWWVSSMIFTFNKARKIYKYNGQFMYIFILIFDVIACVTSYPIMLGRMAIAPIIWIMLESKEYKIDKYGITKYGGGER